MTEEKQLLTGVWLNDGWRLIEHYTSHQVLTCIDSFVLRNPTRGAKTLLT